MQRRLPYRSTSQKLHAQRGAGIIFGRQGFVTETALLGLGPEDLRAGDLVVVMMVVDVPIILRANALGKYTVIGEGYVHGIMDGEAMEWDPVVETLVIV